MKPTSHTNRGFTLIELMVAMVVGLIISGVAVAIFLATKSTARMADALSRYQESVRYASYVMGRDIRMAGFFGCNQGLTPVNYGIGTTTDTGFDVATLLFGYENAAPGLITDRAAGTDVIRVQFSSNSGRRLTAPMGSPGGPISVTAPTGDFSVGDIAVISNCNNVDTFKITSASGGGTAPLVLGHATSGNTSANLSTSFAETAEVFDLVTTYFYVTTTADGRNMLMRRILRGTTMQTEELADGVVDLQLIYGIGSPPTQYIRANAVANWSNVTSVRICLISRSTDNNVTTSAMTYYNCDGDLVTAPDRNFRAPMYFTVSLRNRTP